MELTEMFEPLPCPFCGGSNISDKGYGIQCRTCGVWVGAGSYASTFGGYKMLWNTRSSNLSLDKSVKK